ncbi:MAG: acetyl-CoA acetyltransferase [Dehalococcoidales bacterium]
MSLKDKIAIVGVGCTKFGENFNLGYGDMVVEAAYEAFEDAKVGPEDIDAAWLGTAFPDAGVWKGRSGMDLAEPLGLFDIPITRVSNYCATGGDAMRNAAMALLAGEHNLVLALGVEKLRDRSPTESLVKMQEETGHPLYQKGLTAPGMFAVYATRHFEQFGVTREHLAQISVKNHRHAVLNPKAHYRKEISLESALKSPMVAYPLSVMDSCPTTDGAAAAILCRREDAKKLNPDYALLKGVGLSVSTGWDLPFYDEEYDFLGFRATQKASARAYEQAGIKNPAKEIDLAEVHDCFSIVELLTYEDLGFCQRGKAAQLIEEGATTREGRIPVNVSGGLLSCGHPVGATGLRMVYEVTKHVQGKVGDRQIKNARLGLAHNIGGPGAVAIVSIIGAQ